MKPTDNTTPIVERRFVAASGIEIRAEDDASEAAPPRLVGYAALYNELSDDLGGFREQIAPGAFAKSVGGDVRALINHNPSAILGRTKARTLTLSEDQRGLRVDIAPPDTEEARGVIEAVRRGDIDQMSFGFRTIADTWDEVDAELVRTLIEVELFDVSLATFAAYPQTDVAVRSLEHWRASTAPPPPDYAALRRRINAAAL